MRLWKRLQAAVFPRRRAVSGYEAAANTRRTTGWLPLTSDINTLVFRSIDKLSVEAEAGLRSRLGTRTRLLPRALEELCGRDWTEFRRMLQ